jgi:hypothetical protein
MKDKIYLEAIQNLLIETEGKLQMAIKNNAASDTITQLQDLIRYLRKEQNRQQDEREGS